MTDDLAALAAFAEARLAEDEAEARETAEADAEFWADIKGDGTHFARHDPARVLREVEAGRAVLDLLDRAARYRDRVFAQEPPRSMSDEMRAVTTMMTLEAVVKIRAAVYSDHPDYRAEWAPA